jgi:hypothetical protein
VEPIVNHEKPCYYPSLPLKTWRGCKKTHSQSKRKRAWICQITVIQALFCDIICLPWKPHHRQIIHHINWNCHWNFRQALSLFPWKMCFDCVLFRTVPGRSHPYAACPFYCSFFFGGLWGVAHDFEFGQFVCQKFFIFLRRFEEVWHTIFDSGDLCAKNFSFFPSKISGGRAGLAHKPRKNRFVCQNWPQPTWEMAPGWHTNLDFTTLCAKVICCPAERQSRAGTQNPKLQIRVPEPHVASSSFLVTNF